MLTLEAGGVQTTETTTRGHLASLNGDILAAEAELSSRPAEVRGAIVGINDDKFLTREGLPGSDCTRIAAAGQDEKSANV